MVNLISRNTFDFPVRQHQSRHRIAKPITIGKGGNKLLASIKSPYLMPRRAIIIWNKLIEILKDATSIGVSWHNILIISLLLLMAWLADGILFGSKSGIFTWELSSVVLEIPNAAYTTLSRNLIGCSIPSKEYCKLIGWYWKIVRRQLWTLTCPSAVQYTL